MWEMDSRSYILHEYRFSSAFHDQIKHLATALQLLSNFVQNSKMDMVF